LNGEPLKQISVQELQELLTADTASKPLMLDVREHWEWQFARIDGSIHIPMSEIPARSGELDESQPTVVICHHGMRSLQVVAFLQQKGFSNLHNLRGGIDAWSQEIDPAMPTY
jgi:rhodanese-related sulfurtransferase